jgi:tetratricopeptide (TPR) repeat protein
VVACAALVGSRAARANESGVPASAESLFDRAEAEDARGEYAQADADYRAAIAERPSFREAGKAATRAAFLEAHAEGAYVPFARVEAVRKRPDALSDAPAIDALARDADRFAPGPSRAEAWMLCADAYLFHLGRRRDGEKALERAAGDSAADPILRRTAASELVNALLEDGDFAGARAAVASLHDTVEGKLAHRVDLLVRRRRVHLAALVDLALFALLALAAIGRAATRGESARVGRTLGQSVPRTLGFAIYVALVGGFFATQYEAGHAAPFFAFGGSLALAALLARAWGAAGSTTRGARIGRALLCASAVFAAGFLVLEGINGQYLEGFGL